jgi:hypothetical protein
VECCVEDENCVAKMVALWRWLGDGGFEDLQPDKKNLKQSLYRPGMALRVPGV